MPKGNKGVLKFFPDNDSHTGTSAAILLRNIKPGRLKGNSVKLAESSFLANFFMNCEGFRVRPNVTVLVECQLNAIQIKEAQHRRRIQRAMAMAPELK